MRFSLFSLANANARRRRMGLCLFCTGSTASADTSSHSSPDPVSRDCATRQTASAAPVSEDSASSSKGDFALVGTLPVWEETASEMAAQLQLRCQEQRPLTWVFAGDSLSLPGKSPIRGCSPGSYLIDFLRLTRLRSTDAFVFVESPGLKLETLGANEFSRIEAFRPDVLILTCGTRELLEATGTALDFETMFFDRINSLRKPGRIIAVNLPIHLPSLRGDDPFTANALVRLEALRACSREADLLVIDHWTHWEEAANNPWYSGNGQMPSARGCREIARLMVQELGLNRDTGSAETEAAKTQNSFSVEYAHGTGHRQS